PLPEKAHSRLSQSPRTAVVIHVAQKRRQKRDRQDNELAKSIGKNSDRLEFDWFSAWLRHSGHSHPGKGRAHGRILNQWNPWNRCGINVSAVCILLLQTDRGRP